MTVGDFILVRFFTVLLAHQAQAQGEFFWFCGDSWDLGNSVP